MGGLSDSQTLILKFPEQVVRPCEVSPARGRWKSRKAAGIRPGTPELTIFNR